MSRRIPDRGEVYWVDLDTQSGHEQRGRRPALILSPLRYNSRAGLALCCSLTTQVKGYPFEVVVPDGLPAKGAVLSDQVKCLDWSTRNARFLCRLPEAVLAEVLAKLNALLVD